MYCQPSCGAVVPVPPKDSPIALFGVSEIKRRKRWKVALAVTRNAYYTAFAGKREIRQSLQYFN
jgi:hypothetical protein